MGRVAFWAGWTLAVVAAGMAFGFWSGGDPTWLYDPVAVLVLGVIAGYIAGDWRLLVLPALSGLASGLMLLAFSTTDREPLAYAALIGIVVAATYLLLGGPLAVGVLAERSRRRAVTGENEPTHVLLPRVVAHVADFGVLYLAGIALVDDEWAWILAVGLGVPVHGWLQGRTGYTPGKFLVGIRLIGTDGNPPGVRRALLRYLTLIFEWTGLVGLALARRSPTRQRLGDRWAKTLVVAVPHRPWPVGRAMVPVIGHRS